MERVDEPHFKSYPPVRLYIDDIQSIEQILKDPQRDVSFQSEGFRFDSVSEIVNHVKKPRLRSFEVNSFSNSIVDSVLVTLTKSEARLSVGSIDKSAGVFYKLDKILSARTLRPNWLFQLSIIFVVCNVLGFALSALPFRTNWPYALSIALIINYAWLFWVMYLNMARHSIIILKNYAAEGSFIERNKDALVLVVIGAVLGSALTVVGTAVFNALVSGKK